MLSFFCALGDDECGKTTEVCCAGEGPHHNMHQQGIWVLKWYINSDNDNGVFILHEVEKLFGFWKINLDY